MLSPLNDQPMSEVMEMLAGVANRHNLALSINLINFADDIYKIAYEAGMEDAVQRLELHEQHHQDALIKVLNTRTLRSNGEQGLDKV